MHEEGSLEWWFDKVQEGERDLDRALAQEFQSFIASLLSLAGLLLLSAYLSWWFLILFGGWFVYRAYVQVLCYQLATSSMRVLLLACEGYLNKSRLMELDTQSSDVVGY